MKDLTKSDFLSTNLIDPEDRSSINSFNTEAVKFQKNSYPIIHEVPVLFVKSNGLFNVEQIANHRATTQNVNFHDTGQLKNRVRKALPLLANDTRQVQRYSELNLALSPNSNVLIIGTGNKYSFYQNIFKNHLVINSDVHNQFKVDAIFDAHQIPFKDGSFDLVLSSQVLEHTMRPWIVAKEIMRVTKHAGMIHTEVPFCFPYHGQPYDFFRFSPGGLRIIFDQCTLIKSEVINGDGSAAAYMLSESLINKFKRKKRYLRMASLFVSRILFFWFKYFERLGPGHQKYKVVAAMNISQTMRKENNATIDSVMIEEINENFVQ